ncbi:hypothetical protein TNCV_1111511 [Trichonephila clavipes]|nr:hypothetical protein TNCV_1111511 [Trichonephila clavipes]
MDIKSVMAQNPLVDAQWKGGGHFRCQPRHLTVVQKYEAVVSEPCAKQKSEAGYSLVDRQTGCRMID